MGEVRASTDGFAPVLKAVKDNENILYWFTIAFWSLKASSLTGFVKDVVVFSSAGSPLIGAHRGRGKFAVSPKAIEGRQHAFTKLSLKNNTSL